MRLDHNPNHAVLADLDRTIRDEYALDARMKRIEASLPVYPPFVYRESRLSLYASWGTIIAVLTFTAYAFYRMSLLI